MPYTQISPIFSCTCSSLLSVTKLICLGSLLRIGRLLSRCWLYTGTEIIHGIQSSFETSFTNLCLPVLAFFGLFPCLCGDHPGNMATFNNDATRPSRACVAKFWWSTGRPLVLELSGFKLRHDWTF